MCRPNSGVQPTTAPTTIAAATRAGEVCSWTIVRHSSWMRVVLHTSSTKRAMIVFGPTFGK